MARQGEGFWRVDKYQEQNGGADVTEKTIQKEIQPHRSV